MSNLLDNCNYDFSIIGQPCCTHTHTISSYENFFQLRTLLGFLVSLSY